VAWFALLTALLALVIAAAPTERGEIRAQGFILAGRAQGVAGRFGDGRVVVLGEAMIFMEFGLAYSGFDNRQLALNIVRWLSGELN
jgi:hypothetical protein